MPWKNGGGSTTELLVEPVGATLETGFLWRLSMAALESSGPFSRFDGFDRTLLLLEGRGLTLKHEGHGSVLLARPLEACAFPGEWQTEGILTAGACRDFNVMSDRSAVRHEVYTLRPGMVLSPLPEGPVVLAFCVTGRVLIPALEQTLEPHELLRIEAGGALGAMALEPDTAMIVVVFHPL